MGKKSTAQPRPQLNIPPRGIGPIATDQLNKNDVLCGRGGRINSHEGNIRFRDIIHGNKKEYLAPTTKKLEKAHIAKRIVDQIRNSNPSGRFLKEDSSDGFWYDIGDAKAIKKTGQALREDAPGIRNEMENDSSGDEHMGETPNRKVTAPPIPVTRPDETGSYQPPAPASAPFKHVPLNGNVQQDQQWMSGGFHRQHSAPMDHSRTHHFHHQHAGVHAAPAPAPPPPQYQYTGQPTHGSSPNMYNVPAQFYNGVRSTGNKFGKMSHTAMEAMRHASYNPGAAALPQNQVAFGRVFTPTVRSSGSTMSSISGFSGGGTDQQAAVRSTRRSSASGEVRVSQLSDMTTSLVSLGSSLGLTRSNSLPELGISKEFTSLSDASFAVLMEEEEYPPEQWGRLGSELRDSSGTGTSSSSGIRPPPVPVAQPARNRTASAVSAMSWQSGGSQPSNVSSSVRSAGSGHSWLNPIRSRLTGSIHSDHSLSSSRSVLSEMSADIHALDLAPPRM